MKILLLGATGRTGKLVLKYALEKGFEINCLVRSSKKITPHPQMRIFEGTPSNQSDLEKAIVGCTHIINVLNISRKTDFPWSGLRTPKTFLSDVMSNIISIAPKYDVKQVISCSAWGVRETKHDIPFWFRWVIDYSNVGLAYKDHERQEILLEESDLNYTVVRPAGLTNFKKQKVRETFENSPKPSLTISRKSVADYMIRCIDNESLFQKKAVISKD
tara:strand:- start:880 stop:1530 length:651 start_codon:yes stop_codon:yes gene_type:complete